LCFAATGSQSGNKYRAVFTSSCTSVNSSAGKLTVNVAPVVSSNPKDSTVCNSGNVCFSAAASAIPAATVQWQVSTNNGSTWSNVTGATSGSLCFTAVTGQNGYRSEERRVGRGGGARCST